MRLIVALMAGVLFGAGLTVSQMVNPQKVLNFLDVAAIRTGGWDPTLLFVFAGALPVMFIAYRIRERMAKPAFDTSFMIPQRNDIDKPLVLGSATFGIGWGLGGICPGPALAALPLAGASLMGVVVFVLCMLLGVGASLLLRTYPSATKGVRT